MSASRCFQLLLLTRHCLSTRVQPIASMSCLAPGLGSSGLARALVSDTTATQSQVGPSSDAALATSSWRLSPTVHIGDTYDHCLSLCSPESRA